MKSERFYTNKSLRIKKIVYWIIAIILSPMWLPFYLMSWLGFILLEVGERVCIFFDKVLESVLGRLIPQLRD